MSVTLHVCSPCQILALNGVDPSSMPFRLSDQGLDPRLLPALRVQRATDTELEIAKDTKWGDSLSQRVSSQRRVDSQGRGIVVTRSHMQQSSCHPLSSSTCEGRGGGEALTGVFPAAAMGIVREKASSQVMLCR